MATLFQEPARGPFELRFRLRGIPVTISPLFWISALALGSGGSARHLLLSIPLTLISILLHEMGHALAALRYGSDARILLYGMGGLTFHDAVPRRQQIAISLAGPGAGFVLGLAALLGWRLFDSSLPPIASEILWVLMWINLGWGLMNLLPVLPLDGGMVLDNLLGPLRRRTTFMASAVVALAVTVAALFFSSKYVALLFGLLVVQNSLNWWLNRPRFARQLRRSPRKPRQVTQQQAQRSARTAIEQLREMTGPGEEPPVWLEKEAGDPSKIAEAAEALTAATLLDLLKAYDRAAPRARAAFEKEPSDASAGLAVRALSRSGRAEEAERIAQAFAWTDPGLRDAARAEVLFAKGAFAQAAALQGAAFEASKEPAYACGAARSFARAGQELSATEWLRRAVEAGADTDELKGDPELGPLLARAPLPPE